MGWTTLNDTSSYVYINGEAYEPFAMEVNDVDELCRPLNDDEKVNKRVHDKKSKLEALKDFNRVHTGNISSAKRAKLRAKRKK